MGKIVYEHRVKQTKAQKSMDKIDAERGKIALERERAEFRRSAPNRRRSGRRRRRPAMSGANIPSASGAAFCWPAGSQRPAA